ncbi:hypothetical protein QRC94_001764 [Vibrio vulnificus]|nr:hypothetical protein [Vibrio vulnificus]EJC6819555.1 hypothetical protein [Vibrio vulnificus]EJC6953268.1 hypothetical protein [Vibrio vulnificus]EJC6957830.1 hypothetical protein [Vibrio vulnificus]EKQ3694078.1 hypothetical protein [Vibrio vulnificus]
MQSFISSVFSEMSSRMKTPLLGTFVLSWLAYNHDHVAKLLFSDNTQRIALIESTPFNLQSDLFIPLGLALAYLFIVPLAQWVIDIVKYWLVDKRRTATQHKHLHEKYLGQAKVVQQQSKASLEYWQELHRNRAEDAGRQIIHLKETLSHLKKAQLELESQLAIVNNNYSILETTNKKMDEECNESRMKLADFNRKYTAQIEMLNEQKEVNSEFIKLSKKAIDKLGTPNFRLSSHELPGIDAMVIIQREREALISLAASKNSQKIEQQISISFDKIQAEFSDHFTGLKNKFAEFDKAIADLVSQLNKITSPHRD